MERGNYRRIRTRKRRPVTDEEIQELLAFIGGHGGSRRVVVHQPLFRAAGIRKSVSRIQHLAAGMLRMRPRS